MSAEAEVGSRSKGPPTNTRNNNKDKSGNGNSNSNSGSGKTKGKQRIVSEVDRRADNEFRQFFKHLSFDDQTNQQHNEV
jgi:hypothetical protein